MGTLRSVAREARQLAGFLPAVVVWAWERLTGRRLQ